MRPNCGAEWAGSGTRCLRFARWVAPPGRKTRFRLLARLFRVGSLSHWVPPKGFFDASYIAFLLPQAFPGASARRSQGTSPSQRTWRTEVNSLSLVLPGAHPLLPQPRVCPTGCTCSPLAVAPSAPGPRPLRWTVERTFAWLGQCRRLSKDRERSVLSAEAFIKLAMIQLMLNRLEPKDTDAAFHYRPAA